MNRLFSLLVSLVFLCSLVTPVFANHKDGHGTPRGHDQNVTLGNGPGAHTNSSHKTTVNSDAGIGNGSEGNPDTEGSEEGTTGSGEDDPGASRTNPAGGNANN